MSRATSMGRSRRSVALAASIRSFALAHAATRRSLLASISRLATDVGRAGRRRRLQCALGSIPSAPEVRYTLAVTLARGHPEEAIDELNRRSGRCNRTTTMRGGSSGRSWRHRATWTRRSSNSSEPIASRPNCPRPYSALGLRCIQRAAIRGHRSAFEKSHALSARQCRWLSSSSARRINISVTRQSGRELQARRLPSRPSRTAYSNLGALCISVANSQAAVDAYRSRSNCDRIRRRRIGTSATP